MKTLLLNTFDLVGGAARAAFRLHKGLEGIGVNSHMLVQRKSSDDPSVIGPQNILEKALGKRRVRPMLDSLPVKLYHKRRHADFSPAVLPENLATKIFALNPDIVHLHWVSYGFLRLETLKRLHRPLVWTLHDMWAFTGGCHYDQGCNRYRESCGKCPILRSSKEKDLSRWIWQRKQKSWQDLNLTVVAPSRWLADCVKASSLFHNVRVEIIPNGINLSRFTSHNKKLARKRLSLPPDKRLILFGAIESTRNERKGFRFLKPALQWLVNNGWSDKAELVIFGASKPKKPPNLGFRSHYIGRVRNDAKLALLYAAADIFVAPSTQDNLPNTVMEALACGTPCVAFRIGGMPDMIEHKTTGYLAEPFKTEELAKGIAWILNDEARWEALSHQARDGAKQQFGIYRIAQCYLDLYESILAKY